jgi:hypothetical protein
MKRFISFSATREEAEPGQPAPLQLRRTQEIARQSLVNVGGLTYPLLQRAAMWTFVEEVDGGVVFTFNRQRPFGDVRFERDLSFLATRDPTDDEAEPPLVFLEALTWEFVFTLAFFEKFVATSTRPGTFRIGLGFAGFHDAQLDWAGFDEEREVEEAHGTLTNWRFRPGKDVVAFEEPGVAFPRTGDAELVQSISNVIAEAAFAVKGMRRTAFEVKESRLTLGRASIVAVVQAALARARA